MTPAAWEKDGRTYKVAQDKPADPPSPTQDKPLVPSGPTEDDRRRKLDELRYALWDYAQHHDGQFPEKRESGQFSAALWELPHPQEFHYLYAGGQRRGCLVRPLAQEHIHLSCDSSRLAYELGTVTTLPIAVYPIPHTSERVDIADGEFAVGRPLHLVSLGNARGEKGICEILRAIRDSADQHWERAVAVHAS